MLANQITGVDSNYPRKFVDRLELGERVSSNLDAENDPHPEATFPHDAEGQIWLRCYPVELLYPEYQ
jgi:hypothetical protein